VLRGILELVKQFLELLEMLDPLQGLMVRQLLQELKPPEIIFAIEQVLVNAVNNSKWK
jgi:hypothetical protein